MRLAPVLATAPTRRVGHMYEEDGWSWVWGSMMMLLLLAAIVAVVWFLVRGTSRGRGPSDSAGSSAIEVLARRYARGEIDTEEYRERLAVLTPGPNPPRGGRTRGRGGPDVPGD
ncbi:SHOCT domain-containing protein [Embleya sp. NPDC020886]|uniref:SHOCT domain-containing protein n=1 Tax=Embleya sp. NPDC020886 TaxID=3363980 RepID=UPI0037A94E0B